MRLTNPTRRMVAAKVAQEKFEKPVAALYGKIVSEVNKEVTKALGEWNEATAQFDSTFVNREGTIDITVPGRKRYTQLSRLGNIDAYRPSSLSITLHSAYAEPRSWEWKSLLNLEKTNRMLEEYVQTHGDARKVYNEVYRFLSQFTTYKKARAEWSDLARYLDDETTATGKKEQTALVKTGAELNSYLKSI